MNSGFSRSGLRPPRIENVGELLETRYEEDCSFLNAVGDDFELDGEYPEALEEVQHCFCTNLGGVESATVYFEISKVESPLDGRKWRDQYDSVEECV